MFALRGSLRHVAWQYWLTRSFQVANNQDTVIEQRAKNKKSERERWDNGDWHLPRVTAIEYLEHCTQMADRFNRMFLRMLRQMRDLRRYSVPVTINNPKQVNVQAKRKLKKTRKGATAAPKLKQ